MSATTQAETTESQTLCNKLCVPNWAAALVAFLAAGSFLVWRLFMLNDAMQQDGVPGLVELEAVFIIAASTIVARIIGRFINPTDAHPLHFLYLLLLGVPAVAAAFPPFGTTVWAVVAMAIAAGGTTIIDDIVNRRTRTERFERQNLGDAAQPTIVIIYGLIVCFVILGVVLLR